MHAMIGQLIVAKMFRDLVYLLSKYGSAQVL